MSLARATDPTTSHKAAENKRDVRSEIIAAFKRRPVKGWTDFELEEVVATKTGVSPQRVRTVRAGMTVDASRTGSLRPIVPLPTVTRKTPRGHDAQVFVLA